MPLRSVSNNLSLTGILTVLAVGTFTVGTDLFVLNGLLPTIADDLRVTESTAGQLTTVFAATYAVSSPLIAAATGGWDRRWLLGGGMALFVLGMAGQAAGATFAVVAAARVVAAVGAAAFQATAFVVAGAVGPAERRGRSLAFVALGGSTAAVLGVPIGVLVGEWLGWRAVLWMIAAVALLVGLAVLALPRITVPSAGLRTRLAVLVRPAVTRVLLVTALGSTAVFTAFVYLPVLAADVAPGGLVAWALAGMGAGQVAGTVLAGRWTDRTGPGRALRCSLAASVVLLAVLDLAVLSLPSTLLLSVLAGTAAGLLMVPQQHRLFTVAPDAPTVALGLNGSAMYVGAGLGSALGGLTLATAGTPWLAPAGAAVAAVALLLTTRRSWSAPALATA